MRARFAALPAEYDLYEVPVPPARCAGCRRLAGNAVVLHGTARRFARGNCKVVEPENTQFFAHREGLIHAGGYPLRIGCGTLTAICRIRGM